MISPSAPTLASLCERVLVGLSALRREREEAAPWLQLLLLLRLLLLPSLAAQGAAPLRGVG